MNNLTNMKVEELYNLQAQLNAELHQRTLRDRQTQQNEQEQQRAAFLRTPEAQRLKAEIRALESELSTLPKKIDINQSVTLKMSVEMMSSDIIEMLEMGDEPGAICLELVNPDSLPVEVKTSIEEFISDLNSDCIPADQFIKMTYEGRQWEAFLQKVNDLQNRLDCLYDLNLSVDELLED